MDLFSSSAQPIGNLLPYDGHVSYHRGLFDAEAAQHYFNSLLTTINWESDVIHMFGKCIVTKRKVAWYGDKPYAYTYSKSTKTALPWTPDLKAIKQAVEVLTKHSYNSCLLNLYHNGSEGMGWHSDDEPELLEDGAIASISLGAERKFVFKHKETKDKVELFLHSGSGLLMSGACQRRWLHRLPPTKKVLSPRINLTFRTIVNS
jgi:alkylated DNA repair dioxygenase AlkB